MIQLVAIGHRIDAKLINKGAAKQVTAATF